MYERSRRHAIAVLLCLLGSGCSGTPPLNEATAPRKPETRSGTVPRPELATREKLRQIVERAASQPASDSDLVVLYTRGHALSGTIVFEAGPKGRFSLVSNRTSPRQSHEWHGVLSAVQRASLLAATAQTRLLDIASSTRPIGDDEEPISVTLRAGASSQVLTLWHGDAVSSSSFHEFEKVLMPLLVELSAGAIIATAD